MTSRFPVDTASVPELDPELDHDPVHDPVLAAIDRAPVGEPYSPEQRVELDQILAGITTGKEKPVLHTEIHAWLERKRTEEAEVAAE